MKTEKINLYVIGMFEDGKFIDYFNTDRQRNIRVYESIHSAKSGVLNNRGKRKFDLKILKVNSLEVVTE